jgi:hypothetical protein
MKRKAFDFQAARRTEIERTVRIFELVNTDDVQRFLIAWKWHNSGNTKDPIGALILAVSRMGGSIAEEQAELVIKEAATTRQCRTADALARYLGITDKMRRIADLKTIGSIDVSKRQRARRRKEQKRMRIQNNRRAQGAKPRAEYEANSLTRAKPWEKAGISRRTWYYRQKSGRATLGASPGSGSLGTNPRAPKNQSTRKSRKAAAEALHKSVPNPLSSHLHKSVPNLLS